MRWPGSSFCPPGSLEDDVTVQVLQRDAALIVTFRPSSWLAMDRAACGKGSELLVSPHVFGLHVYVTHIEVTFSTLPRGRGVLGGLQKNVQPP